MHRRKREKKCIKALHGKKRKGGEGGTLKKHCISAHTKQRPVAFSQKQDSRPRPVVVISVCCPENARVTPSKCRQTWHTATHVADCWSPHPADVAVRGIVITGKGCRFPSSGGGGRGGVSTPRRRAPTGTCCPRLRGWSPACGWCPRCHCSPPSGRRSGRTPAAEGRSLSPTSRGSHPRRA